MIAVITDQEDSTGVLSDAGTTYALGATLLRKGSSVDCDRAITSGVSRTVTTKDDRSEVPIDVKRSLYLPTGRGR